MRSARITRINANAGSLFPGERRRDIPSERLALVKMSGMRSGKLQKHKALAHFALVAGTGGVFPPLAIGEPHGNGGVMNGFVKRELPSSDLRRHFEFRRKVDGEIVELITSVGFAGTIPEPSVLVNAHISPWRRGGRMIVDELIVVA